MQQTPAETSALPPSRAGSLALVGGAACLNFANTSSGRGTPLLQEHLRSYELLLVWCVHAGVLSARAKRVLHGLAAARRAAAARILRRALALREAIHSVGAALSQGKPLPADALDIINREFAAAMAQARLRRVEDTFVLDWAGQPPALDQVLRPLVRSAAELLLAPSHGRIKQCPGCGCGWIFLDQTKNRTRRWCEMEVCGSRAKVRRYRERQRKMNRRDAETQR